MCCCMTHSTLHMLDLLLDANKQALNVTLSWFAGLQIVAFDFGCKNNILRRLASFGCKVTVVPSNYPASKVMDLNPDGIFLSNGPVRSHEQQQQPLCRLSIPAAASAQYRQSR